MNKKPENVKPEMITALRERFRATGMPPELAKQIVGLHGVKSIAEIDWVQGNFLWNWLCCLPQQDQQRTEPKRPATKKKPVAVPAQSDAAAEAIAQCEEILSMIEDLPERAEDFGMSVAEKVQSIATWIEENDHVTPAQQESLDNMQSGVGRWLE